MAALLLYRNLVVSVSYNSPINPSQSDLLRTGRTSIRKDPRIGKRTEQAAETRGTRSHPSSYPTVVPRNSHIYGGDWLPKKNVLDWPQDTVECSISESLNSPLRIDLEALGVQYTTVLHGRGWCPRLMPVISGVSVIS